MGVTPADPYKMASKARISASVVAQLVAKRTTVWVASGFSQKLSTHSFSSSALRESERVMKI